MLKFLFFIFIDKIGKDPKIKSTKISYYIIRVNKENETVKNKCRLYLI